MQRHIKNYMQYFNYRIIEDCSCEVCGSCNSLDIHHIEHRQKNNPKLDQVSNLICLCRICHIAAHSGDLDKYCLYEIHNRKLCQHKL